jgi:beta-mannosidase
VEQFTDSDDDFLRCAHFPTEIHRELLAAGLIADPFVSDKEESVQWVGEASWLFRSTFEHNHSKEGTTELVFGGLDTFATVWLDGEIILETDNGFLCDQRCMSSPSACSALTLLSVQCRRHSPGHG